jgi:hypothetical protein
VSTVMTAERIQRTPEDLPSAIACVSGTSVKVAHHRRVEDAAPASPPAAEECRAAPTESRRTTRRCTWTAASRLLVGPKGRRSQISSSLLPVSAEDLQTWIR